MSDLAGLLIIIASLLVMWYMWLFIWHGRSQDGEQIYTSTPSVEAEAWREPVARERQREEGMTPERASRKTEARLVEKKTEADTAGVEKSVEAQRGEAAADSEEPDYLVPESMINSVRETYELLSQLRVEAERLRRLSGERGSRSGSA